MKSKRNSFAVLTIVLSLSPMGLFAQGFVDQNHDGVNDWFCDANGDGVNDVDGKAYAHDFEYADADQDGINDLWTDCDGDGVNDQLESLKQKYTRSVDYDGDGLIDEEVLSIPGKEMKNLVIDMDRDGVNDVTGESYSSSNIRGNAYGRVSASNGRQAGSSNRTGNEAKTESSSRGDAVGRSVDRFIDLDGDGIADDRQNNRLKNAGRGRNR